MIELHQDISIYDSRNAFEEENKTFSKPLVPSMFEEQYRYQRQRFERLKFTYLEQEARDKFLRMIFDGIEPDLEQMSKETNETLQNKLSNLEETVLLEQDKLDLISEDIIKLKSAQEERLNKYNSLVKEFEGIELQFNEDYEYNINEEFNELINNIDPDSLKENDIINYIKNEENKLVQKQIEINELNGQSDNNLKRLTENQKLIKELNARLLHLIQQNQGDGSKNTQEKTEEYMAIGTHLSEVNKFLSNFSQVKFQSKIVADDIVVNVGEADIILDKVSLVMKSTTAKIDMQAYNESSDKLQALADMIPSLAS